VLDIHRHQTVATHITNNEVECGKQGYNFKAFIFLLASAGMGLFLLFPLKRDQAIPDYTVSGATEYI
jgi:hypothetical protein